MRRRELASGLDLPVEAEDADRGASAASLAQSAWLNAAAERSVVLHGGGEASAQP